MKPLPGAWRWRILGAAALAAAAPAFALQVCSLDGTPVDPANGASTAGRSGMMRCRDADSGQLQREQELQDGVFMGLARQYRDGKLARDYKVNARGNIDGPAKEFGPEGQLLRESVYDDGTEVGLVRSYHANGKLRRVAFRDSSGLGSAVADRASAEFTPSGQLAALRCGSAPVLAPVVDDARLCGFKGGPSVVELFDEKGLRLGRATWREGKRIRSESLYDNGLPATQQEIRGNERIERRFSSEGVKRRELVSTLLERGQVPRIEQEFSEAGSLLRDRRWNADGQPQSDDSFYLNGQPRSKARYSGSEDTLAADITEFHDNGQRAAQGHFLTPPRAPRVAVGAHQRFNENGVLAGETDYDARGRIQRERSWDDSGALLSDEAVFADGSRKAFSKAP